MKESSKKGENKTWISLMASTLYFFLLPGSFILTYMAPNTQNIVIKYMAMGIDLTAVIIVMALFVNIRNKAKIFNNGSSK